MPRPEKPPEAPSAPAPTPPPSLPPIEAIGPSADPVELVRAAPVRGKLPVGDYAPVTLRGMKQTWRRLRRMVRRGPATELDVAATIDLASRRGTIAELVLRPRRINDVELLLFVDHGGSMVPFHELAERVVDTATRGGRFREVRVLYFHDVPEYELSDAPRGGTSWDVDEVLAGVERRRARALIFSDGGAARGGRDADRLDASKRFLDALRARTPHVVWLNPMP